MQPAFPFVDIVRLFRDDVRKRTTQTFANIFSVDARGACCMVRHARNETGFPGKERQMSDLEISRLASLAFIETNAAYARKLAARLGNRHGQTVLAAARTIQLIRSHRHRFSA